MSGTDPAGKSQETEADYIGGAIEAMAGGEILQEKVRRPRPIISAGRLRPWRAEKSCRKKSGDRGRLYRRASAPPRGGVCIIWSGGGLAYLDACLMLVG